MNGYIGFYRSRRAETHADTLLQARAKLATQFKAKHDFDVTVMLAEKDGAPVVHIADF